MPPPARSPLVRARTRPPRAAAVLAAALAAASLPACGGPHFRLRQERGSAELSAGPFDLGLFASFRVEAQLTRDPLPPPEDVRVFVHVRGREFERLTFIADGRSQTYPRIRFQQGHVWIPLAEWESIGSAESVALRFDRERATHPIAPEPLRTLHRFTARLSGIYEVWRLEPLPGRSASGASP